MEGPWRVEFLHTSRATRPYTHRGWAVPRRGEEGRGGLMPFLFIQPEQPDAAPLHKFNKWYEAAL